MHSTCFNGQSLICNRIFHLVRVCKFHIVLFRDATECFPFANQRKNFYLAHATQWKEWNYVLLYLLEQRLFVRVHGHFVCKWPEIPLCKINVGNRLFWKVTLGFFKPVFGRPRYLMKRSSTIEEPGELLTECSRQNILFLLNPPS